MFSLYYISFLCELISKLDILFSCAFSMHNMCDWPEPEPEPGPGNGAQQYSSNPILNAFMRIWNFWWKDNRLPMDMWKTQCALCCAFEHDTWKGEWTVFQKQHNPKWQINERVCAPVFVWRSLKNAREQMLQMMHTFCSETTWDNMWPRPDPTLSKIRS